MTVLDNGLVQRSDMLQRCSEVVGLYAERQASMPFQPRSQHVAYRLLDLLHGTSMHQSRMNGNLQVHLGPQIVTQFFKIQTACVNLIYS